MDRTLGNLQKSKVPNCNTKPLQRACNATLMYA